LSVASETPLRSASEARESRLRRRARDMSSPSWAMARATAGAGGLLMVI
jgi:hypothetical protein